MHGAQRERPDRERGEPVVLDEPSRCVRAEAVCEQEPDRLLTEPPPGECHHGRRRWIEPLDVVDGDQHRAGTNEHAERLREGRRRLPARPGAARVAVRAGARPGAHRPAAPAARRAPRRPRSRPGRRDRRTPARPRPPPAVSRARGSRARAPPPPRRARSSSCPRRPLPRSRARSDRPEARRGKPPSSPARRPSRSPRSRGMRLSRDPSAVSASTQSPVTRAQCGEELVSSP